MNNILRSFSIASLVVLLGSILWGQTPLYSTNFGTTASTFPAGWSTSSTGTCTWIITSTSASSTYSGASGSMNATATNGNSLTGTATLTGNPGISTVGYTNITVLYGARRTSTFTNSVSLEWSTDGTTWNAVTFTEVANDGTWALANGGTRIALPAGAEGAANLRFRRVYTVTTGTGTYRMDDFSVQGTAAAGPTIMTVTSGFNGAFGYIGVGTTSGTQSFTVGGTSLTNDIVITPPTGFEIRKDANAFSNSPITLTQSGGTVSTTTIDVRFSPAANQSYSGNITCTSTSAATQNVAVSGTGGIKSTGSGNWSSTSTWVGGVVPDSTDNVSILSGNIVTVDISTARCKSIEFGDAAAQLNMSSGSVLGVYGNFTLFSDNHNAFSTWTAGAKVKFTGSAATQTLSGWNIGSTMCTSFMELQVDKSAGKLTTSAANMKLNIGTSLEIINGTFELAVADDINGRDLAGTAATPTITVQSGGTFTMLAGASQIQSGTTAGTAIGKMTIYGTFTPFTTSTNKINIGNIDIESGGTMNIGTGWTANLFNAGTVTIKAGGTLENSTTTDVWFTGTVLTVNNTGVFKTTSITTALPATINNNGTFRYARPSASASDQTIVDMNYYRLELSFTNAGTKKIWTLGAGRTISDSLETNNSAILQLLASTAQTLTVNGTIRMTSGSIDNSNGNISVAMGNGTVISRATGTISNAPTFGTSVDLRYTSISQSITTGPELPTSSSVLNNLTLSGTGQTVTLGASPVVNGVLTLSGGTLILGAQNITLASGASIAGTPSSSSMIVSNSTGELRKEFSGTGSFTYPVGDNTGTAEYSPATLNFTAGTFGSAYAGIRVTNAKHPDNGSTGNYLSRYWTVSQSGITSFNCSIALNYLDADITGDENNIVTGEWNGASWSANDLAVVASNQLTATVSSFGDFTGAENTALPVELQSFAASVNNGIVRLGWSTATEMNNHGFEIQRSSVINGRTDEWMKSGFVEGAGNSNTAKQYSYSEKTPYGRFNYRLKQIDQNGKFKFSPAVEVNVAAPNVFALDQNFPNPFNPTTSISYQLPKSGLVTLTIYDMLGKEIASLVNEVKEAGTYSVQFNATPLSSGVYLYRLQSNEFTSVKRMLLVK
ncbi:MAG: T9SS type A sorting domain-containing protein [Bacteroidota bacterium]